MIKLTIYNFGVAHTDFMEDLLEYPYEHPILFNLKNDCYISEKIDIEKIFLYCKNKYNYTNDDIHYFKYSKFVEELKKYYLYFDIKNSVFLISLSDTKANDNIIGLGCLKKEYEGELSSRDKELFLLFKYTKV